MSTEFQKLSNGWNAEPNAPEPSVSLVDGALVLEFTANGFIYPEFQEDERLSLVFHEPARWRLGPTNDEGWYRGQCRFSSIAPAWGEFYEVSGDLRLHECPDDWKQISRAPESTDRHFLFYLRDETFECTASNWELRRRRP